MSKVLIADDSDMMRKIAKMALEKAGFEVVEAKDGSDAVEKANEGIPDVILLDAEMPEMDGWEACSKLKSDSKTSNIPIIICTGHDLTDEQDKLKKVGAKGFIAKPYNPAQLISMIEELVNG